MTATDAPSSALPFGNITLFSPKSPNPTNSVEKDDLFADMALRHLVGAGLGKRQSSQGWAEVMRGLLRRITTHRLQRCGLVSYTKPADLQDWLTWEHNRIAQNSRIEVELNKRGHARARCEWEHKFAQACWVWRGRTIKRSEA